MRKLIVTTAAAIVFSSTAFAAGPKLLTNAELDKVVAGFVIITNQGAKSKVIKNEETGTGASVNALEGLCRAAVAGGLSQAGC